MSIVTVAALVICSAIAGGHVGYFVGVREVQRIAQVQNRDETLCPILVHDKEEKDDEDSPPAVPRFPDSVAKFAVGMSLVPRDDFAERFDMGVPLLPTEGGNEHVLIIYNNGDA
jgi:hypothetical protein